MEQTTTTQRQAAVSMVFAVSEAIRQVREIPSGELYAMLMNKVDIEGYEKLLGILKSARLIEVKGHLIKWIGPHVAEVAHV